MDSYTEKLEAGAVDLYEWNATERLPQIISSFRGHGAALSEFLNTHGYPASGEDRAEAKAAFLKKKFSEAGIGSARARNAYNWLTSADGFERETAFRIAFALNLNIEKTDEFFRTVMLDRGFDCHTIKEAIWYFCIYSGRDYSAAEKLIAAAPNPEKSPVPQDENVLYTKNIISFIRSCGSEEALLRYFRENLTQFGYNQVKAKEYIRSLWKNISETDGLAAMERKYFPSEDWSVVYDSADSTWNIYLQILGLGPKDVKDIETDRTIRPILENRIFMHEFASDNFPTRQSIEKLLRGESTQNDLIRKTLIMLAFYRFWMDTALSHSGNRTFMAQPDDRERCLAELDQYLMDAGFPEMYAGNPYDWIFLWAAGREAPLISFRNYWGFLSAEFSERNS